MGRSRLALGGAGVALITFGVVRLLTDLDAGELVVLGLG